MEGAEEDELTMENSISGHARLVAYTGPLKRQAQTANHAGPFNVLHCGSDQRGIGSYIMSVEAAEEEVQCMEENGFGNVGPAACTIRPKRPTQATSHAGPSFVWRFGSDPQGISSCRMSMEAIVEEDLPIGKSISGNVRPPAYTRPPRRPTHTAGYARPSDVLRFGSDQGGIASCRMSMEAAEGEVQCTERNISGNARSLALTKPPRRLTHTIGYARPFDVLRFGSDQQGIASCGMSVEVAEEKVQCTEKNTSRNVRLAAYTRPPKRPAQTARHSGPFDVLHFGSDQRAISSCRLFVEAAEEEVRCMERGTSGNVRLAACTGPPTRPTQIAGYAGVSMGTPGVATLV